MNIPPLYADILATANAETVVFDIGAGDGRISSLFAQKGAKVLAIDSSSPPEEILGQGIQWIQGDIRTIDIASLSFEPTLVICRNIFQFLDKNLVLETLLPKLVKKLQPNGVLFIETFSAQPEPPFPNDFPSYYQPEDFVFLNASGAIVESLAGPSHSLDRQGQRRLFHKTTIAFKKANKSV